MRWAFLLGVLGLGGALALATYPSAVGPGLRPLPGAEPAGPDAADPGYPTLAGVEAAPTEVGQGPPGLRRPGEIPLPEPAAVGSPAWRLEARPLPPDVRERGDAALEFHLVRADDGSDLDGSTVVLWRLDEPANVHWRAGARRVAEATTEAGRAHFGDLAPGRYRASVGGRRVGAEDPPAFEVPDGLTRLQLAVEAPGRHPVRVKVFLPDGGVLERGWISWTGGSSCTDTWTRPEWVRTRTPRLEAFYGGGSEGWHSRTCGRGSGEREPVLGDADGLVLGEFEGPAAGGSSSASWQVGAEGHGTVRGFVRMQEERPLAFVAATVPLTLAEDLVRLPDGRRAVDVGARLKVHSEARLVPPEGPPPPAEDLTIVIEAHLEGYRPLVSECCFARLPWKPRVMRPVER